MSLLDIDVDLDERVAEVGQRFTGTVRRPAHVDDIADDPRNRVRAARLSLMYWTEGRGDTDKHTVSGVEVVVDKQGAIERTFGLPVPADGPISYDGRLMRVLWQIEVRVDIKLRIDSELTIPVLVVPRNGWSLYNRPHPLPR